MRLVFSKSAAEDFEKIIAYIAAENNQAAKKVADTLYKAMRRLVQFPQLGHKGRINGVLELSVPRLPYIIVYKVAPKTITILAVFHAVRNLAKAWDERPRRH